MVINNYKRNRLNAFIRLSSIMIYQLDKYHFISRVLPIVSLYTDIYRYMYTKYIF